MALTRQIVQEKGLEQEFNNRYNQKKMQQQLAEAEQRAKQDAASVATNNTIHFVAKKG